MPTDIFPETPDRYANLTGLASVSKRLFEDTTAVDQLIASDIEDRFYDMLCRWEDQSGSEPVWEDDSGLHLEELTDCYLIRVSIQINLTALTENRMMIPWYSEQAKEKTLVILRAFRFGLEEGATHYGE